MDEDLLAEDLQALMKASQLATAAAHKLLESKKEEVKKKNVLVASKKERERTERLIRTLESAEDEKMNYSMPFVDNMLPILIRVSQNMKNDWLNVISFLRN
ncbi:hypothetical protein IW261DRAFT_1418371 [Armillaria novae-zelandiae]|uniref:Uncharacterized protein n=1 Tax=Armillaria novae-zelandiae TaxID=153914 RepID=A0AA39UC82_9AGAR|nr:hypothetical protein IW261DRAFT_1418371 [Armillaria novae-zelandiae]